jgi:hypothetical protein
MWHFAFFSNYKWHCGVSCNGTMAIGKWSMSYAHGDQGRACAMYPTSPLWGKVAWWPCQVAKMAMETVAKAAQLMVENLGRL